MTSIVFPNPLKIANPDQLPSTGRAVGALQDALVRLKIPVSPSDVARKELSASTQEALRAFQQKVGMAADGRISVETVDRLNAAVAHAYVAQSKTRTQRLQALLQQVGQPVESKELEQRTYGTSTETGVKAVQARLGLPQDGRVTEQLIARLRENALQARLASPGQRAQVQGMLLRALNIAKLGEVRVDAAELKSRTIGASTRAAIQALQTHYGLPANGNLDAQTFDRIESIARSVPQPVRRLKARPAAELAPVKKGARLNMQSEHVRTVQGALAFLGYPVDESEFKAKMFGKSTRAAVLQYQQARGLPPTGHAAGETLASLNREIERANPEASLGKQKWRLRGSVRDELWQGMAGVTVEVWEMLVSGPGSRLAARPTGANGFFDVPYDPPRDAATKQVRTPFHLRVNAVDGAGQELGSRLLFNPTQIAWVNFTKGEHPYRGSSEFQERTAAVGKAIGNVRIEDLAETPASHAITQAAQTAGLLPEDVMRLVLAHRVAHQLADPALGAEACYAFIAQNLPPSLPGDLIGSTVDWTLVDSLVLLAANGIVFMEDALQALAFENAVALNLIPIAVGLQKAAVLAALARLKQRFVLEKPILVGNGSLKALLHASAVQEADYPKVATAFLKHRSFGQEFWDDVQGRAAEFGGAAAIQDFRTTVEVGHITKNFDPLIGVLKQKIADPTETKIRASRDLAKLTQDDWVALLQANGSAVPPNTDGATQADKVRTYAATLVDQGERLFPAAALVAAVRRSGGGQLTRVGDVEALLDAHPKFDLRAGNIDVYVREQNLAVDEPTLTQARVLQRVHRIAPTAAAGQALVDRRIHSSAQIVAMGKERLVEALTTGTSIDRRMALTVYGLAQYQYGQVLQRLADYRFDLHRNDPAVIVKHTYGTLELPAELRAIPDLQTLFGSLDACNCDHCQSVYGPAAYLADILRFLDEQPSEVPGETVRELLFQRRQDLGNVKLNCPNTETPLPYIDLVCEVLENAMPAPAPAPGFSFQTRRTAAQLRAAPENVRKEAYELLRSADFPLKMSFDLWQEQARVMVQHLGVTRWQLMEAFQVRPVAGTPAPRDFSIAGEYFGMSSHEVALVCAAGDATDARQKTFWGITTPALPGELSVADFLRRSSLRYSELLDLLSVAWINPPGDAGNVVIVRPDATCDLDLQKVTNLTAARLDKMHRLLRLRRHVPWALWELDLLLRSNAVGQGTLDETCLVRLQQMAQLRQRLGLPADKLLALFGDLNTESRLDPQASGRAIPSLYETLFLNSSTSNPVDAGFTLPLPVGPTIAGNLPAQDHRRTLLAAFELVAGDLEALRAKLPSDALSLGNLSQLARHAWLAKGMGLGIDELLVLESLAPVPALFASPASCLQFIEQVEWVRRSPFSVQDLDYLLQSNASSALDLRDAAVAQSLQSLRQAVQAGAAGDAAGIVTSQVAAGLGIAAEAARLLLAQTSLGGQTLSEVLRDPAFLATDADGTFTTEVTPAAFPQAFEAWRLLHKTSLLVQRFAMQVPDLEWLLAHAAGLGLLVPNALPVSAAPAAPLFGAWRKLADWMAFRTTYPEPEDVSLRAVFDLAAAAGSTGAQVRAALAALTQWDTAEVDQLATALQLQHPGPPSDFLDIDNYVRMEKCRRLARRLGVGPATAAAWCDRDTDAAQADIAQQARLAAKARYDDAVWLEKVTPLEDSLREKKRDALAAWLVAKSLTTQPPEILQGGRRYANPAYWRDSDDLSKYYLIDVQMSACQATSRIKQAMSSVQMFVQRCLLGLEQPRVEVSRAQQLEAVSDNSWRQWKWMKSYRIWEANRKVFLYPENWIEPELRDDKSPFFEELESDLAQVDLTEDNAGEAFLRYVQKVHEVARLDIVGTYHELDDTDPRDNLPPDINVLHVVGRTRGQPAVYYYRRFDLNDGAWSAWEKIDLDIQSEQVVPVVYNRRLHLFWLHVLEKPQKLRKMPPAKAADQPTNTPEPPGQLEIQLCWSARAGTGWSSKRISQQKLIHPWQRPLESYNLKPRYKSRENQLWLDLYISQSREFNSTQFWDAYTSSLSFVTARHPQDEAARPWHSSSFVFDGEVVDVKMKGLAGQYHIVDSSGVANEYLTLTTSLDYVHGTFGHLADPITALAGAYQVAPRLPLPDGMRYRTTRLANNSRNGSQANVLENSHTRTLLSAARSPFQIVASQHSIVFDTAAWGPVPLIYQDNARSFFIRPEWQQVLTGYNQTLQTYNYNFYPFYHPYTALFMRELKRSGIDGLLNRRLQTAPQDFYPGNGFDFAQYAPTPGSIADETVRNDRVDFARYGAYALYNWEIFFHAPLMIACKLTQNQKFEEAMRWFHCIFDPTNTESPDIPQRYWITRPFFEQNSDAYRRQRIENLLKNIDEHQDELRAWRNHPFQPHLIARYRPVAYQKTVVMKYIDNLIAWGDQLFRRDTIEAINEATTLYLLAYEMLGRRPARVPDVTRQDKSYNELTADGALDPFGNRQVEVLMENFTGTPVRVTRSEGGAEPLPTLNVFYFGIPGNDRLLTYWDTVENRLFNIRNCRNIEGVVRQLPLFEPAIDPALLVKAAAAGVDLDSVAGGLAVAAGPYRFRVLAQKAQEFCAEVKALGDKLHAALEKKDAEALALLRNTHETALLEAVKEVRKQQVEEANASWAALEQTKALAENKKAYFESRDFINVWEGVSLLLGGISTVVLGPVAFGYALEAALALVPKIAAGASGFGGSPHVTVDPVDGKNLAAAASAAMQAVNTAATILDKAGAMAATMGGFQRRQDEWTHEKDLAVIEIAQADKQILAAQVRHAIAERELENQEQQIEQSRAVTEYMRSKFTSEQLFDWELRQVSALYFGAYVLAYDMARRAEKSFELERGVTGVGFVRFGHWDSLKKGLFAGERLAADIRRMEAAWLQQDARELELTKHVSLAQLFPLALLALKESGACTIVLPEWLFDMDYPGHYFRRLKAVSISIPCVVGPYTGVNCTLSLVNHGIRVSTDVAAGYGNPLAPADERFLKSAIPQAAIATSHGQEDAGMFQLAFNDERFLPFEGAGAVSEWRLDLAQGSNQFDLATVSDVVLHVRYTARNSGEAGFVQAAKANLAAALPTQSMRMLALEQEFSSEWYRFLHPQVGTDQVLSLRIGREHLPFYARGAANVDLLKVTLVAQGAAGQDYSVVLTPPGVAASTEALGPDPALGGRQKMVRSGLPAQSRLLGDWEFKIQQAGAADFRSLPAEEISRAWLVLEFRTR